MKMPASKDTEETCCWYRVSLSHTMWSLTYLMYALRMYVKRYNLMYSVFFFNGVTSFRFSFVHSLGGSSLSFSICALLSCLFNFFFGWSICCRSHNNHGNFTHCFFIHFSLYICFSGEAPSRENEIKIRINAASNKLNPSWFSRCATEM